VERNDDDSSSLGRHLRRGGAKPRVGGDVGMNRGGGVTGVL
jgi:hypothetical protein